MAGSFQISAGVLVKELDFSLIIPTVAVNIGAIVIDANWGPVNEITLISNEPQLVSVFEEPVDRNASGWFAARNFLTYSQNLYVVRYIDDALTGASASPIANAYSLSSSTLATISTPPTVQPLTGVGSISPGGAGVTTTTVNLIVENFNDFQAQYNTLKTYCDATTPDGNKRINWLAKYPGLLGDSIVVSYVGNSASNTAFLAWQFANLFSYAPQQNELCVAVLLNGEVVETFFCSLLPGSTDGNNQNNYLGDVVNQQSNYVYVLPGNFINFSSGHNGDNYVLGDVVAVGNYPATNVGFGFGGDCATSTSTPPVTQANVDAQAQAAWALFTAASDIDINYCMQGGQSSLVGQYIVQNVAQIRKDCIGFLSPAYSDVVANLTPATSQVTSRNTGVFNIDSSYGVLDGNYKYQFDNYNGKYRWVPFNGDIAGLMARTAFTNDPWWSPAGFNRGQINDVVKLAWNPTQADRDALYAAGINPIVAFPGMGTVLYGDKTMQARPSAFDRINVRMLFIVLEKAISKAAQYMLFEFNDVYTQMAFKQMVTPYLRQVQAGRGIQKMPDGSDGFYVLCDSTINTPQIIDSNQFVAAILIKPNRSINFITLSFAATATGVEFSEIAAEITGANPANGFPSISG